MPNRDTMQLLRRVKKQGAMITQNRRGMVVVGPLGATCIHMSTRGGKGNERTRKRLRQIGFDV